MMSRITFLILLLATTERSVGQTIGEDVCSCSPSIYNFTLDFSLFCPPVNVTQGDGILRSGCLVNSVTDPNEDDLVPVIVDSIDVVELDQDLTVIVQDSIPGTFEDGDSFLYTSFAADADNIITTRDLPKALQVNLYGFNQNDTEIVNSWIIQFTNDCEGYPVFLEGESAGWVRFSNLSPPLQEFCPAAPAPMTPAPVPDPTSAPVTPAPVPDPTPAPVTPAPVPDPTPAPVTPAPVSDPTPAPVTPAPVPDPTPAPETPAPVSDPTPAPVTPAPVPDSTPSPVTPAPVVDPTSPPAADPTPAPIADLTPAPISDPTPTPVPDPTPAPVADPTPAPTSPPVNPPVDMSMSMALRIFDDIDDFEEEFGMKRARGSDKQIDAKLKTPKSPEKASKKRKSKGNQKKKLFKTPKSDANKEPKAYSKKSSKSTKDNSKDENKQSKKEKSDKREKRAKKENFGIIPDSEDMAVKNPKDKGTKEGKTRVRRKEV